MSFRHAAVAIDLHVDDLQVDGLHVDDPLCETFRAFYGAQAQPAEAYLDSTHLKALTKPKA